MAIKYTEAYLAFYDAYPRKEGKADGQKAHAQLSESEQAIALADVEKRKRMGAYSSNKKLIQLPASYLRARRWEDDWADTLESSRRPEDLPSTPLVPRPIEPSIDLPWKERLVNRCFFAYRLESKELPEVASALQIKREILRECEILDEEPAEQATIIAELFMSRMDATYGMRVGAKAIRRARANKREEVRL